MINIGEISKPSVSETRVKPKRSKEDAERVVATESIDASAKVSAQLQKKSRDKKQAKDEQSVIDQTASAKKDSEQDYIDDLYDPKLIVEL